MAAAGDLVMVAEKAASKPEADIGT